MNRRSLLKLAAVAPIAGLSLKSAGEEKHVWTGAEFKRVVDLFRGGGYTVTAAYMSPWTVYDLFNDGDFVRGIVSEGSDALSTGVVGAYLGVKIIELPSIPHGKIDWVWS